MRRWIRIVAVAVLLTVMALGLAGGWTALAAGPSAGTGPWVSGDDANCLSPQQHEMYNTKSDRAHCFRD